MIEGVIAPAGSPLAAASSRHYAFRHLHTETRRIHISAFDYPLCF